MTEQPHYAYDDEDFSQFYDKMVENLPSHEYWLDTIDNLYINIVRKSLIHIKDSVGRVIELGTGTATTLLSLKNHLSIDNRTMDLIGVDNSKVMLQRAIEKIDKNDNINIRFHLIQASLTDFAEKLPFEHHSIDCILLTAGTFHHLITDQERIMCLNNIHQFLKFHTGLGMIYLIPECAIHIDDSLVKEDEEKINENDNNYQFISQKRTNWQDKINQDWYCEQIFQLKKGKDINRTLKWTIRTCTPKYLINLLMKNGFKPVYYCLNGIDLINSDQINLKDDDVFITPFIVVFQTY
ncbi:unnamed protein product [Didymodactylos carnosus]|uniref:Methyltransferase domain-containing protein n=1 Tax=Didymodactylos carnosus TaxID=1234261 RepID=A0A813S4A6_9BILA|nr:unnamed protein product [Didymodactylos carnosus]CAF0814885.1 unnamed protein product [Didymodactylos carnosus]CAF3573905.1 unnamed protein product [Didymodactylos carnosus]CAF3598860.1 unnamed protein product [Didymodactylos carnosus]